MVAVVFWQQFDPAQFNLEFDEDELAAHYVTIDEVVEVIMVSKCVGTSVIAAVINWSVAQMAGASLN